jgi:hypothetical protein
MKVKTLSRKNIIQLEQAVKNGVYAIPARKSEAQDAMTKKLIEQLKSGNESPRTPLH